MKAVLNGERLIRWLPLGIRDLWKSAPSRSIEATKIRWRAIRDEYRNFLMSRECAKVAQVVGNLEWG